MNFQEWWVFMDGDVYSQAHKDTAKKSWYACKEQVLQALIAANRTCDDNGCYINYEDLLKKVNKL